VIDAIPQSQGNVQTSNVLVNYKQMSYCSDFPHDSNSFVSENVPATSIPWYNLGQYGQGNPVSNGFYNNITEDSVRFLSKKAPPFAWILDRHSHWARTKSRHRL
jgi:hypothetical protein